MQAWRSLARFTVLLTIGLFLSVFGYPAYGEPEENGQTSVAGVAVPYDNIRTLIDTALTTEAHEIEDLKAKLAALDQYEKAINTTLNAVSLQQTTHRNILLSPETDIQKIIQAKTDNESAMSNLSELMKKERDEAAAINNRLAQVEEQLLLNQKQRASVQDGASGNPVTAKLIRQIDKLDGLLQTKKKYLQKMAAVYQPSIERIKESYARLSALEQEFETTISQKKKESLFKRGLPTIGNLDVTRIYSRLAEVPTRIGSNLKNDYRELLKKGYLRAAGVVLFVVLVLIGMLRFKAKIFQWHRQKDIASQYPWRHLVIRMAGRSLPLGWLAVVLYFFGFVQNLYATIFLLGFGFVGVYVWLLTRWGLDIVYLWNQDDARAIPKPLAVRIRRLMFMIRYLTLLAVFLVWMYGRTGLISAVLDFFFYLILTAWCIGFIRKFKTYLPENTERSVRVLFLSKLIISVLYLIPLGGIIINISGYRMLSAYWLISWSISLSIALWSWLTFNMLREWQAHFRQTSTSGTAAAGRHRPLQWFFIQTSWLIWLWMSVLALSFAWYIDKTRFLMSFAALMNFSLTLGSLSISLFNILEAAVVLLLTHVLTRIWPKIFEDRFLADSGMNTGIKSSITVITIYAIWMLGFLMVLNIIGVDFKTMAVAFGGLGIGLGFGLQAIFNNFFSGIILLFERPIQVGDVIEVGGVWGEVKKINVRATLIQTYDNASLLIPNSEFISGQVTNWSLKDLRVRRTINVGVAYGSDIEQVRKTLIEIADAIPEIYKYPKPVVLFTDFADSALVFQLRVWTHLDNGLTVETAVRFAIDRAFKEKEIAIPFPQRDIHLRSMDAAINTAEFNPPADKDSSDASASKDHIDDPVENDVKVLP